MAKYIEVEAHLNVNLDEVFGRKKDNNNKDSKGKTESDQNAKR